MLATMSNTKNNDCDLVQNEDNEYLDGGVIHDDDDDVYNCDDVCCNSMQWVLVTDWGAPVHNWPSPLHDAAADDDDDAAGDDDAGDAGAGGEQEELLFLFLSATDRYRSRGNPLSVIVQNSSCRIFILSKKTRCQCGFSCCWFHRPPVQGRVKEKKDKGLSVSAPPSSS